MIKKKWFSAALGFVVMAMAGTAPILANEAQAEGQETETEIQETGTETSETEGSEEAEEVILTINGRKIAVKNETGAENLSVEVEAESAGTVDSETDAENMETDDSEASQDTEAEATEETLWTVTFSGDEGESHTFATVNPGEWTEAVLTENYGFWYLQYTAENGETGEAEETAEEQALEEALTMWTLTDVYVRESADSEAQAVKVASLGDECKVTAVLPGWFQVEYDGVTGYIRYKYLTDDKSASEAAVAQEQSARAAEEAAAAAQAYSSSGSGSSSSGSGGGSSQQECLENGLLN